MNFLLMISHILIKREREREKEREGERPQSITYSLFLRGRKALIRKRKKALLPR